jgi:hypothetical protein
MQINYVYQKGFPKTVTRDILKVEGSYFTAQEFATYM